ncbi:MAG: DNA repair protein RecO [Candidatus Paceibacterota bacterium]|jgi:DNA repair protein RecO (recombination protein O)
MYRVYTTKAIVLGSKNAGEANKYYFLLTRELGLITAFAQGVRELKSKLRHGLEQYSYVQVSLIRGKEKWRLTNVAHMVGIEGIKNSKEKAKLEAKLCALVQRLVHGEEADIELFDELVDSLKFLARCDSDLHDYELLAVLRVLDRLGYIAPREAWLAYLDNELWKGEALPDIAKERKSLLQTINESLYHSQL